MKPEQIAGAFVSGVVTTMASEAAHDAYNQEIHDNNHGHGDHTHEDVPTHVAHALGRMVGHIAKATINPYGPT